MPPPSGLRPPPRVDALLQIVVASATFAALTVAVAAGRTKQLNTAVRQRVHPRANPMLRRLATIISAPASPNVRAAVAPALGMLVGMETGWNAVSIPLASLLASVLDRGMRVWIHQERPPGAPRHRGLERYAFPSGHTSATTAIGVAIMGCIARHARPRTRRRVAALATSAAFAMAWSRLYLDEHWADDVVGGWLLGLVIGKNAVWMCDHVLRSTAPTAASLKAL